MDQQEETPVPPQERDQLNRVVAGPIDANEIAATNVASVQYIEKQEIHHHKEESLQHRPPLQRPLRSEHFTDREQEQHWLIDTLKPGRIVTLCGPGGMGKTALIAEALWKLFPGDTLLDTFPDGLIFHSFYRQPEVAIALEQIARLFGEDPLPTPALAARRALSRKSMLLVFDGAEEADDLRHVLEVCAGQTVLVASRRRADAIDPRYLRDLHPLPEVHAVAVVQAWGEAQATNEPVLQRICRLVGNLPLALRLVGRYLALHQEEAEEYLQWLRESPLAVLDQGKSQRESVPVLLERSVARVSEDARHALVVVGLLAPAPFDRAIIAQVLDLSTSRTRQALNELQDYGLLLSHKQQYEVSHALIHTYAREVLLPAHDHITQRELIRRLIQGLGERFAAVKETNQEVYGNLLPHVQACLVFMDQDDLTMSEMASLFAQAGAYLSEQIRYVEAEPLYQRALAIREHQLGPQHPDTATSLNNLAYLYQSQGKYVEAEPLYQRALAIYAQQLGPAHPNTRTVQANYAALLQRMQ